MRFNQQREQPARFSSVGSVRRLGSLLIALVLVLMLMQEAGNPNVYRKLFYKLGVPMTDRDGQQITTVPTAVPAITEKPDVVGCDRVVSELSEASRDEMTELLARRRRHDPGDEEIESGALSSTVGSIARELEMARADDLELAVFRASQRNVDDDSLLAQLQAAIDKTYFSTLTDGAVWERGDFKAFYRSLEARAAGEPFSDAAVYVGVVPLVEQSVVYRGRHIAITGEVVRVTQNPAKPNLFGIEDYWTVWLRPIDGSERPFVVSTPRLSKGLAALEGADPIIDPPTVDIDGVYLKRLLYPSVGGYDQAPAIVGTIAYRQQTATVVPMQKEQPVPVAWVIAAAAFIGIAAAGIAFWTLRQSEQRHRTLRSRRGNPSFDELELKP